MADRKRQKSRSKPRVRKTGYVIAAFFTAVSLGLLVWFTMDLVSAKETDSSVPLKKTPITTTTAGTSVVTAPAKKEPTTVQTEKTEKVVVIKVDPVKLEENFDITENGGLRFSWEPSANATGYYVYRLSGNVTELIATIDDAKECSYNDFNALPGSSYSYMVTAFAKNGNDLAVSENSNVITFDYPEERSCDYVNMYLLPKGTQIFRDVNGSLQLINTLTAEGYYTGTVDDTFEGYTLIDYMLETVYVRTDKIKYIENTVALPTSVIGQEGGQIFGSSACGPTAASVIVCYDKGDVWDKDDCIRFAEANKLCDQGSMTGEVGEGGMSAPYVIKFIEMYSNGQYSAENVYSDKEKPSETLKKMIDKGCHSILSVRYAWGVVHHQYSIVHFIEPCAYSEENGKLYFYYGDTAYGNGPKGLVKVSADEIDQSVAMVDSEPKCIIVLKPNSSVKTQNNDAQNTAQ